MPRQPPPPPQQLSLFEQLEIAKWMSRFPALTVMVFLRPDLGYRIVNPVHLVVMFFIMFLLSGYGVTTERSLDLFYFAVLMLCFGFYHRLNGWRKAAKGQLHHSYYIGTSLLESFRWAAWMKRNRRISRFVDPVVCIMAGFIIGRLGSCALGFWLMLSGFALRAFEYAVYTKEFERRFDIADGLVEAQIQSQHVEDFSEPIHQTQSQPGEPGVSTGLGNDIQEHIKRRDSKPPIIKKK